MDDQTFKDDELRTLLMTLGIDDTLVTVDRETRLTGREEQEAKRVDDVARRLPRLMQGGASQTIPELRIKGKIGEGGMGLVELAEQLSLGREVAVKTVRAEVRSERATLTLLREGWTTGLLEHPNIVPVYTLGRGEDGEPVIVMKKISGTSWLEVIEDPSLAPAGFDAEDTLELHVEILSQVCNAVHYAHSQGIIHRDLKPENVMLGEFGEVYVLDWGIAVSLREDTQGRLAMAADVTMPAGTPVYMAPEMVTGEGKELGTHTDIFLLGSMLYEVLTGEPRYLGNSVLHTMLLANECQVPTFGEETPPELAAICRRAMARDPEERFESARTLQDALHEYRRHRQSRQLAAEGRARLDDVRHLFEREEAGQKIDERALYKVFGECRFAYEQSLKTHSDNPDAIDGLQAGLELMIHRELAQGALKSAALLLAELPRPNQELQERHAELAKKISTREEDYEELQQIRHDVDVEVGRKTRAYFTAIMGVVWILSSVTLTGLKYIRDFELTLLQSFFSFGLMTTILAGVLYFGQQLFYTNEVNRRLLHSVVVMCISVLVFRFCAWQWELPYATALSAELTILATASGIMAVTVERRLWVVAIPCMIAALASTIWLSQVFFMYTAANTIALGALIVLWWPRAALEKPQ